MNIIFISGSVASETEKLFTYTDFEVAFDDKMDMSILKKTKSVFEDSRRYNYEFIVGNDLAIDTVDSKYVILADNFENRHTVSSSYLNGSQIGAWLTDTKEMNSKDAINISYVSLNNAVLDLRAPIHYVDISNQPVIHDSDDIGIIANDMPLISMLLRDIYIDLNKQNTYPNLIFPKGSSCIVFGKVNVSSPHYEFKLSSYDPISEKIVSNKLEYNTINELIEDKSRHDDAYLNTIVDYVGINNKNKVIRIPNDNKYVDIDTAYVEYNNAVYETIFFNDFPENNLDIEQGSIKCKGFNPTATEYLETEIIKNFK